MSARGVALCLVQGIARTIEHVLASLCKEDSAKGVDLAVEGREHAEGRWDHEPCRIRGNRMQRWLWQQCSVGRSAASKGHGRALFLRRRGRVFVMVFVRPTPEYRYEKLTLVSSSTVIQLMKGVMRHQPSFMCIYRLIILSSNTSPSSMCIYPLDQRSCFICITHG